MNRRILLIYLSITLVIGVATVINLVTRIDHAHSETSQQAVVQKQDPELVTLVKKLKSGSPEEVPTAFHALVEKQATAIPVLQAHLSDPETRHACVEILTRISAEHSVPVLVSALEAAPEANPQDRYFKSYIIGALGRLKAQEAVAALESRYKKQETGEMMALSIAWALKEITGKDYGPAFDPWKQGKVK